MKDLDSNLFDPVTLGEIELKNRIVMASMSRARTDNPGLVPNELQVEYYRQRASAGLILTEGTWPSEEAIGAVHVPGLYTTEQAEGGKRITDAVHEAGGKIVVQLGHTGAASHPDLLGGKLPLAPSAVDLEFEVFTGEMKRSPIPRPMSLKDIDRTISDYARATRLAQDAGFDGVELHGTASFLIPQFLSSHANRREDDYGGSIENRSRFPLEILRAMIAEWMPGRVGFKLCPGFAMGGLQPNPQTIPTFEYLVQQVSDLNLAYVQFQNAPTDLSGTPYAMLMDATAQHFRKHYRGSIIANGGLHKAAAESLVSSGDAQAVAVGAYFLSNPDLVDRIRRGVDLAPIPPRETWYGGGAEGYLDYPTAH